MSRTANLGSVPLPPDIRDLLLKKVPAGELNHWALEAILVEAAREHIVSRRKAATLLGLTNYLEREAFFKRHHLTNEYTLEMVDEDFEAIAVLEAKRRQS